MRLVGLFIVDGLDVGIDQHFEAMDAGGMGDVNISVANRAAVARGLRDRVDLGVNRPVAVLLELAVRRARLVDQTPDVKTVR